MFKKPLKDSKKRKRKTRRPGEATRLRGAPINIAELDYKNVPLLQRLTSAQGKLFSRKRSGLNAMAQRRAALALKRARHLALMPFVS